MILKTFAESTYVYLKKKREILISTASMKEGKQYQFIDQYQFSYSVQ